MKRSSTTKKALFYKYMRAAIQHVDDGREHLCMVHRQRQHRHQHDHDRQAGRAAFAYQSACNTCERSGTGYAPVYG